MHFICAACSRNSAIYGMKYQSRCIEAQLAQTTKHCFLVGTLNPREENEIHLIEFDETDNNIRCQAIYRHPHEVWSLASSPANAQVFSSCYHTGQTFQTSMWRMRDDKLQDADDHGQALDLVRLFDFEGQRGLTKVHWHTLEGCGDQLMTLDEYALRQFTLQNSTLSRVQFEYKVEGLTAGAWNPHHSHSAIAAVYRDVLALDMRAQTPLTTRLAGAHEGLVRDVDYNPNKPYHIATAGDDRKICIWDLRRPSGPLCSMTTQSHWVWAVKFNRFHDQLLLSAGSNSSVSLWSAFSVSSAPLGDMEDAQNEKDGDSLVKTYEEHEDSVYTVAWSPCDAWIFASLSYDGRVVVNHVPPTEKYKILL